ncbi:hypothetical protein QFC20_000189 [Naganishia adeliensis]|uniref:Uncharacterized protein n=1 Tax=Naganishia adeliensis TaxID=92952 RepID=A0ACC2X1L2_9TREE|nr:hypothetical protein QFC20_000189 [Naganishia adeliensis]
MQLSTLALLFSSVVGIANAFPVVEKRENATTAAPFGLSSVAGLNVTYSSPVNSSLPNVVIFATGGTIAGSSSSNTDTTGYQAGVVGVAALVQAVPELLGTANIVGSQISNIGSEDMNATIVLRMAKLANEILCSEGSQVDGLVITHGTDTMEETAYFMDATVNCHKPVVLVGAMRPSTAISADGPANLLQAVNLAADPAAKDRGAMIVLNDRIGAAYYTIKTNANTLETFRAMEQGYLGMFLSSKPVFYYPAAQPIFKKTFDVTNITELPKVDVLYGHQDFDYLLIRAAVANGAKAIVIAGRFKKLGQMGSVWTDDILRSGTGAGSQTSPSMPHIDALIAQGYPVIASSKVNVGAVVPNTDKSSFIRSGFLNPVKSRMQAQLALASGYDLAAIRASFEDVLYDYLY